MKKGFTLIELLAVIVILGIILAIAIPSVALIIERSKEKSWENQQKLILQAAEKYIAMNPDKSPREGETIKITLENLIDANLIEENIRNPKTNEIINPATEIVQVTNEGNGKFSYIFIEIDENLPKAKVYGVRFNLETVEVERLYDAVGMSYEKHTDDGTITSDFDTAEIYGEFEEVTDSYGNKFVKIPKFFIKKIKEGKTWTYLVSKVKQDNDYYLPACFYDEEVGVEHDYILVGKYLGSISEDETRLESKSGKVPLVSANIKTFRNYAKANNSGSNQGYQLIDIHTIDMLQTLFYIEFATLDSQSVMRGFTDGYGNGSPATNGVTDEVSTPSGSPTSNSDGKYAMKYRGIENLYGNIEQFIDGINIKNYQAYVARNAKEYESNIFDGAYQPLSYVNARSTGYVVEMGFDPNNPFVQMAIEVNHEDFSYYKDSYSQNTGDRIALFGGDWKSGSHAGISNWNLYYSSSIARLYIGSRLLKTPL